jgi:phospholipase C
VNRRRTVAIAASVAFAAVAAIAISSHDPGRSVAAPEHTTPARRVDPQQGIHKIKHIIVVMQENRSFDSYFGTFPGADGLPRSKRHSARLPASLPRPQRPKRGRTAPRGLGDR